jgi:hypothetical protein
MSCPMLNGVPWGHTTSATAAAPAYVAARGEEGGAGAMTPS